MGAWGSGSFENDTALDWAAGVESVDDVHEPFDRLKALTEVQDGAEAPYVAADLACEVIAAAETVAMLMGRRSADFPDDLFDRLAGSGPPDDRLFHQAREAVGHVLRSSELAELWAQSAEESGVNEWHAAITALVDRLNPDIDSEPWQPAEVEAVAAGAAGPCAFCGEPVGQDELFHMTIRDLTDRKQFDRGFWCHLPCLNARLHHQHAIVDLKFDAANLPDLDDL